jgi:hypothetical protein
MRVMKKMKDNTDFENRYDKNNNIIEPIKEDNDNDEDITVLVTGISIKNRINEIIGTDLYVQI